jgi:hypothetical protein
MPEGWLTFTDFGGLRAIAIRAPVGGHWDAITLANDFDAVKIWRTDDGEPAVVEMKLDPRSGYPVDELWEFEGIRLLDLLHSPTLGPGMVEGVVWSQLEGAARDFAAAAGVSDDEEADR